MNHDEFNKKMKDLDAEMDRRIKHLEMVNNMFYSIFPKLSPPENTREIKVNKPLMYSDFEKTL